MFNLYNVIVDCKNDYSRQFNFSHNHLIAAINTDAVDRAINARYNRAEHAKAGSVLRVKIELLHSNRESYMIR